MKNILIMLLLFASLIIAQPRTGLATKAQLDTVIVKQELIIDSLSVGNNLQRDNITELEGVNTKITSTNSLITSSNTKLDAIQTATEVRTSLVNSTGGYGAKSVGVSAIQLSASSVPCKKTTVLNNTNGSILYYGFDGSLTTSNGSGVLRYLESKDFTLDNLNKIYLIATTTTDVRFDYEN